MSNKPLELTGNVMSLLDPIKTVRAARTANVPPLLCLACTNSDENGRCTDGSVDIALVKAMWHKQLSINQTTFHETLKADTPLIEICSRYITQIQE